MYTSYADVLESYMIAVEAEAPSKKDAVIAYGVTAGLVALAAIYNKHCKKKDNEKKSLKYTEVNTNRVCPPEIKNLTEIVISKEMFSFITKYFDEIDNILSKITNICEKIVDGYGSDNKYESYISESLLKTLDTKQKIIGKEFDKCKGGTPISITSPSELNRAKTAIYQAFGNRSYIRWIELDWGGYDDLQRENPQFAKKLNELIYIYDSYESLLQKALNGIKIRNDYTKK